MSNNSKLSTLNSQLSFKVWVRCATFNHAPYITATMDGFCMQQTDFPYVCVIFDDASKDGEQEVLRKYLREHFEAPEAGACVETDDYHLTFARHQENKNCYFAVFLLKYNHFSIKKSRDEYAKDIISGVKYVAMCEGDDYWTDEHKLQKQVDALDANHHAMMVYTNFRVIDGENKPVIRPHIKKFPGRSHSGDNLPTLLRYGNYVMTLTTMYRSEVLQNEFFLKCPTKMDFALTLAAAFMGDFIWLPEQTACYRSLESGIIASGLRKGTHWIQDIYRYYAGLVMNGQCKPISFRQRCNITTIILMRALAKKDQQLKKDTLRNHPLSYLLLPVAFIKLKIKH